MDAQVKFLRREPTRGILWRVTGVYPKSFEDQAFEVGHFFDHKSWLRSFVIEQVPDFKSQVPQKTGVCSQTTHRHSVAVRCLRTGPSDQSVSLTLCAECVK